MTGSQPTPLLPQLAEPDIVVALPHLSLVEDALTTAGVEYDEPETSEALGLARLELTGAARALGTSGRDAPDAAEEAGERAAKKLISAVEQESGPETGRPDRVRKLLKEASDKIGQKESGLDRMLLALRAKLALRYEYWSPMIGKNRILGRVWGGDGAVHHGDGGAPSPSDAPQGMKGDRAESPGQGVRVGLVDTGLFQHSWLVGGWTARYSDLLRSRPVKDSYPQTAGHATFLTGLILGQAPAATVEVRRVLEDEGYADSWKVANEIVAIGQSGVDILNLSLMCYTGDDEPPLVMSTAIDRLDREIVVVAAAGNHGDVDSTNLGLPDVKYKVAWPAGLEDVVAVGASNREGQPAKFTPPNAPWIDFLAPGVEVVSTYLRGQVQLTEDGKAKGKPEFLGFASWQGTSFAAALVSGSIAAGTIPGRVTARQALAAMWGSAEKPPPPETSGLREDRAYTPPVVRLAVPVWT